MLEEFKKVSCFGNENSKHPLIYLRIAKDETLKCPYCAKEFSYDSKTEDNSEH